MLYFKNINSIFGRNLSATEISRMDAGDKFPLYSHIAYPLPLSTPATQANSRRACLCKPIMFPKLVTSLHYAIRF